LPLAEELALEHLGNGDGRCDPDHDTRRSRAGLTAHLKTIETVDHAARLDALERKAGLK
jgi:hypothetical protein